MTSHVPWKGSANTATHTNGLRLLQWNTQHNLLNFDFLFRFWHTITLAFFWFKTLLSVWKKDSVFWKQFLSFLPSKGDNVSNRFSNGPLVAIPARSSLRMHQIEFTHNRVCDILLSSLISPIEMLSVYIHYQQVEGLDGLSRFVSLARSLSLLCPIGADSNEHNKWWVPSHQLSNEMGMRMEEFIVDHNLEIQNRWPCSLIFVSERGFESCIDVTLTASWLSYFMGYWETLDDTPLASNHVPISFSMSMMAPWVEGPDLGIQLTEGELGWV